MKAIIQAYSPEEIERIVRGEQTVKVCKTAPKNTPFKVYMYCTKDGYMYHFRIDENRLAIPELWNGKVVGEFVCERVTEHEICDSGAVINYWAEGLQHSCLTISQIDEYVGKRSSADYYKKSKISALHIHAVKFYDEPKELSEFYKHDNTYDNAFGWVFEDREKKVPIKRPPQSWMYVEEIEE